MAKKKNVYNQLQYDKLRREIDTIINFIETLDVENIEDDIDWGVSSSGKVIPTIISTIERKIKITVSTIAECGSILLLINEKEGLTPYLESRIFLIKNCLESIQTYYERRPVDAIDNRIIEYQSGKRKDGSPIHIKFIIASRFSQISERMSINKKVLEVLPIMNKLESLTVDVDVKGGKEVPESMLYD
jgi:hypothetical protein